MLYFIWCGAAAGIFNAWNRAQNILYTIWLKARTGSSSSMTAVNNNKRIRNGADSCFLTTMIMIEKTLSFLSMMITISLQYPSLLLLPYTPASTQITIKKTQQ